jgi:antirestriction protein ArdC
MYMHELLGQQIYEERLQEAQRYRVATRVRALGREQGRMVRVQRQMSRAHARARRIRLELQAET